MKVIGRNEFLKLPENTLYFKTSKDSSSFGDLEVKASGPNDGWGNDWITDNFFVWFTGDEDKHGFNIGDEFRFDDNQTVRDGLYESEDETYFAVFDNEDIMQVIDKLKKCLV